jgi:hypothetical protein
MLEAFNTSLAALRICNLIRHCESPWPSVNRLIHLRNDLCYLMLKYLANARNRNRTFISGWCYSDCSLDAAQMVVEKVTSCWQTRSNLSRLAVNVMVVTIVKNLSSCQFFWLLSLGICLLYLEESTTLGKLRVLGNIWYSFSNLSMMYQSWRDCKFGQC